MTTNENECIYYDGYYPNMTTLRSGLLSQIRLSSVRNVRAPYSMGIEAFGNISSPLCTLAIL